MTKEETRLARRAVAEAVGTALLLAAVAGSGIMGERLAAGNVAIALLANTLATGAALVALILCFGHISGAHFNPAVTWHGNRLSRLYAFTLHGIRATCLKFSVYLLSAGGCRVLIQ
jgi:hypothetical protein